MITSGTRLLTKDGRKIGNAIVIHEYIDDGITHYEGKEPEPRMWVIETDFGNLTRMSENQIYDLWYINEPCELEILMGKEGGGNVCRWMADRYFLITNKAIISKRAFRLPGYKLQKFKFWEGSFILNIVGIYSTYEAAHKVAMGRNYTLVTTEYVEAIFKGDNLDEDFLNAMEETNGGSKAKSPTERGKS